MGFTAVEKILMNHAVTPTKKVSPGDIIVANVEYSGNHEGWAATSFNTLSQFKALPHPEMYALYMGHHMCTANNNDMAANYKKSRETAAKMGVKVYDQGSGICHIQIVEQGIAHPGSLTVFADSHTLGCGVTGGIGVQCGEMMGIMLNGSMWFKIPETHKYILEGKAPKGVYPRDVVQYIIGDAGMDASVYKAMEWDGSYIHSLPVELRFPFTMMSVEMGAKTAFIEPDDIVMAYVKEHVKVPYTVVKDDPDARIEKTRRYDVSKITEPQVAAPSNPGNTQPISKAKGARIDQVCIGTCCGSSIYDLRVAAQVLKGHKVKARTIVVPGTRTVYSQAAKEGLVETFIDAGADMYPAFCGTCQTLSVAFLAPGETQMHPGPRNWEGRTVEGSFTYLGSPATCAASAIEGQVADCRNYL
jgi:homoaconitase/3-isopropylmalate dehydratase large subunit